MYIVMAFLGLAAIYLYAKVQDLKEQLAKEKRKQLVYKSELNMIPRDYEDGEEPYQGIVGDK